MWLVSNLFSSGSVNWDEKLKFWKEHLRLQKTTIESEIRKLDLLDTETKRLLKLEYKDRPRSEQVIIVKELVHLRKCMGRLYETISTIKSVETSLILTVSQMKMNQAIGKSTEILKSVNKLISVPLLSATMREFAIELEKAGVIQDELTELKEEEEEEEILDEAVNEEIEKIMDQIFDPSKMPSIPSKVVVVTTEKVPVVVSKRVTNANSNILK
jgi:charged multivesicular body protein 3